MTLEISDNTKRYCLDCSKELGYLDPKTNGLYKSKKGNYFFSVKPHTSGEYRKICFDCFFKQYNRLPRRPNTPNDDIDFLLKIDLSEDRKKRAVTLDNLIKRHGVEDGTRKFNEYCQKQALSNKFEYKKNKHGWTKEQFEEYNSSRAVTLDNLIKRHGVEDGTRKFNEYCQKQAYAGTKLEYFQEKFGPEEGMNIFKEIGYKKSHSLQNYIKKFGEEEGKAKYENFCQILKNKPHNKTRARFSKISQRLFRILNEKFEENNFFFATNNKEFCMKDTKTNKLYFYDFVCVDRMKVIEFNGTFWHADPRKYKPDDYICAGLNATKIWDRDEEKLKVARDKNFSILVVWEEDFVLNEDEVVKKCLDFLK